MLFSDEAYKLTVDLKSRYSSIIELIKDVFVVLVPLTPMATGYFTIVLQTALQTVCRVHLVLE